MRPSFATRALRLASAAGLAAALLAPSAQPAVAADPLVLRVGTTQDVDSLNPYQTALVSGYEAFLLSYNLLVDFGPDLQPIPGFADSWERAADGHSWRFHIRTGMQWSDGQPATAQDVCFSFGLAVAAHGDEANIGLGYLDPGLSDAAVSKVACPDDQTVVMTTDDPSERILQTYLPIIPKHIWGNETYKSIADAKFDPPLVGTGPYQAVEWKTGQYVRFERNPHYWGTQGAADEVVMQIFKNADTMLQALRSGEIDYARGLNPDQLNALKGQANIATVVGVSNGWNELGYNCYGDGTGKTIKGGGASTKALQDPAFRQALGYAIDKQTLVDRVLGGYGQVGTTNVPPVLAQYHVEPTDPRTFDIELAKQKLEAAGYLLDANGRRLDKEGKVLNLRLYMPDSSENYPKDAQFIKDWFGQLGIRITTQVFDSGTLTDLMLPPEAGGDANKANYDLFIWSWYGNPDPNALLQVYTCSAIGTSSDSNWCDPAYDKLYDEQNKAQTVDQRKALIAQMQQLFYDQVPHDILYYDGELDAYRTDRFAGWQNMPQANGVPLFTYGTYDYTLLTDATVVPSPSLAPPTEAAVAGSPVAGTPAPAAPTTPASTTSDNTPLIAGAAVVVLVVVVLGFLLAPRRRAGPVEEE